MAKGQYQQLYEAFKERNESFTKASSSSSVGDVQSKTSNLDTRLQAGGVDTSNDTRNFLEKALNLTPDQNVLFDIFEVIGRPQQALFGAIDAAQTGQDAGKAALEGLTGDRDTSGKQILMNTGKFEDEEGKLNLVDVLGFAGDVLLDPADLALIPATGGLNLAVSATADAARAGIKGANALSDVSKVADAAKAANTTKKSLSSLTFDALGGITKAGAKTGDDIITAALKKSDEAKGITYKTPNATSAANMGKVGEGYGKLESYKDVKDQVNRLFNTAASIPTNVKNSLNKNNSNATKATRELQNIKTKMTDSIDEYVNKTASKLGDTSEETVKKLYDETNNILTDVKEFSNINRETSIKGIIDEAKNGKLRYDTLDDNTRKLLDDTMETVNAADRGLKLSINVDDQGIVKLSDDWNTLNPSKSQYNKLVKKYGQNHADEIMNLSLPQDILNTTVTKKGSYNPEQLEKIQTYIEKLNPNSAMFDEDFAKLYDNVNNVFTESNAVVNKYFGTNLTEDVVENAGYVRHQLDEESFSKYKDVGNVSKYATTGVKGDARVLSPRELNMSVSEANNVMMDIMSKNKDNLSPEELKSLDKFKGIFKNGYTDAFDGYLNNIPKLAKESQLIDEVLIKETFKDSADLKKLDRDIKSAKIKGDTAEYNKLIDEKTNTLNNSNMKILTNKDNRVPRGFIKMTKEEANNMAKKMNTIASEFNIKEMADEAAKLTNKSDKIAVNADLFRLVGYVAQKESGDVKGLLRIYDSFLNNFKKFKTLSPTFHMNNIAGNTSNMMLAGVKLTDQVKLFPKADSIIKNSDELMDKVAKGIPLSESEKGMYDIWEKFIDDGFGAPGTALDLTDMPDNIKKMFQQNVKIKDMSKKELIIDLVPYMSSKMNNAVDTRARLVTYMKGLEDPNFLRNLGVESAGEAVRKVNLDPSELTSFEKNIMKRIMPFYTFTKKNLAFQMSNLGKNGERYNRLMKSWNSLEDSITGEDSDVPIQDWMKENFYMLLPGTGENGEYKAIRATLPFGNLVDTVSDPLGALTSTLAPAIRSPIEYATNTNSFLGSDIENFEGEMSSSIPYLTKKQEYLLGNLSGLDVPLKNIEKLMSGDAEDMFTMTRTREQDELDAAYTELDRLETMMSQYEQQGYEFATMKELEESNYSNVIGDIMSQLNKYNGSSSSNPYSVVN